MVMRNAPADYMVLDRDTGKKFHVNAENRDEYSDRGRYIRLKNEPVPDKTPDPVAKAKAKATPTKSARAKRKTVKK